MQIRRFVGAATAAAIGSLVAVALVTPALRGQTVPEEPEIEDLAALALDEGLEAASAVEAVLDQPDVIVKRLTGGGPWVGVEIRDIASADVTGKKLETARGVLIERVIDDSPAAKAGVKAGDVVVGFDGETVRSARQFTRLVHETPADRTVKMTLVRDGSRVDLDVTPQARSARSLLGPRQERRMREMGKRIERDAERIRRELEPRVRAFKINPEFHFDLKTPGLVLTTARLGMTVQRLAPQLAEYFGVKQGVLVSEVEVDSPAAKAGVKAGDVITAIDGKSVDDASELRQALRQDTEKRDVTLSVMRNKQTLSLKVTLPERPQREPRGRQVV